MKLTAITAAIITLEKILCWPVAVGLNCEGRGSVRTLRVDHEARGNFTP